MSCQQSVGHDHLLDYSADRGHNCRTCRTLLVQWLVSVFYRERRHGHNTFEPTLPKLAKRSRETTEAGASADDTEGRCRAAR